MEGSGKSFQSQKLFQNLNKKLSSILTREPGGTRSAELIRNLILKITLINKKENLINILIHCCILLQEMNMSLMFTCTQKEENSYL